LLRSTLPRHHHSGGGGGSGGLDETSGSIKRSSKKGGHLLLSAYEPLNSHGHNQYPIHYNSLAGINGSRSSWAGLPSSNGLLSCAIANSSSALNGSSSTLLSTSFDRRDDTATPIVEEGRIRSILSKSVDRNNKQSRADSAGSFIDDFDCCDGGGGGGRGRGGGSGGSSSHHDYISNNSSSNDDSLAEGTPSPSDSGVAELEALLKEKDCEIGLLRETLEQNEAVIFQVYQEKERSWERELKKLRSIYEERMRASQQQASQAERQLQVS